MGYFDKWVGDRFEGLPDGRAIFYPKGRDGPGYLVPDQETRSHLERAYKAIGAAGAAAGVLLAHTIGRRGVGWYWLFSILLLPVLQWYVGERAAERLVEISEPYPDIEARDYRLQTENSGRLWLIVAGAAAGSAAAVLLSVQHESSGVRLAALAAAILLAFVIPLALQELRRIREIDKRRSEMFPSTRRLTLR